MGKYGVRAQPEKLAIIQAWPVPQDPEQIRSFLGMCVFYQSFVPGYAELATPLYNLCKKDVVWKWGEREQLAFDQLRLHLLQAPVLAVPDSKKAYVLHTDASDIAMGATSSQAHEEGKLHLIACRSKKFKGAKLNYPVH